YTLTVTDVNGCTFTQPFDVTEPGMFSFDGSALPASCDLSTNGSIQVSATGGTSPYTYSWTGPDGFGANTANINGLAAGIYHLTLTDANGCSALYTDTIGAPAAITVFAISNKNHGGYDITCAGAADGEITTTF